MGKHSVEKKANKKIYIYFTFFIVFLLVLGLIIWKYPSNNLNNANYESIKNNTSIEGKKLVFKSTSLFNKIMEYSFQNNVLSTVKIYEQFEKEEDFKNAKEQYENKENVKIINVNEQEKSIEIEKLDFGTDNNMSYEEVYNKYLIQIIGAYEKI